MMLGFSDREPDNWDMAAGTVRGYRWWTMTVPLTQVAGYDPLTCNLRSWASAVESFWSERLYVEPYLPHAQCWVPDTGRCEVQGMHGGQWNRGAVTQDNGRFKAQCAAGVVSGLVYGSGLAFRAAHGSHALLDPRCGCGFWAYWRELPQEWESSIPYVRKTESRGFQRGGCQLSLPVAGVIEGSGRTIIGERGFRCEYARITDLTFNVNGDCIFYDENQVSEFYGPPPGGAAYSPPNSGNPRNAGSFAQFTGRELGIRFGALMDTVRSAAKDILGNDINWHGDVASLLDACPPDVNYG